MLNYSIVRMLYETLYTLRIIESENVKSKLRYPVRHCAYTEYWEKYLNAYTKTRRN